MSVYIPSWVINFTLTFDDRLTVSSEAPASQITATPQGIVRQGSSTPLVIQPDDDGKGGKEKKKVVSSILGRVPRSATLERPGTRQAGRWTASFDFVELPIDPRTVSDAAVEIHFGTLSQEDLASGMAERSATEPRRSVIQTKNAERSTSKTMRMLGIVDEWVVKHSDSGSTVELSGRDLRGFLLDRSINPEPGVGAQILDSLDLTKPITQVIMQLLSYERAFAGYTVITNPSDWPDGKEPVPGGLKAVPRHRKGAKGTRKSPGTKPPANLSGGGGDSVKFWDVIVRLSYLVGGVPYVDNQGRIVVRPGKNIFNVLNDPIGPSNPAPFKNGVERVFDAISDTPISPGLRLRKMVYGRDVIDLEFRRKLNGEAKPKVVRAYCWDPDSGEKGGTMLYGLYPPRDESKPVPTKRFAGKATPTEEIVNYRVPGIRSKEQLESIAESLFHQLGRDEVGGSIATKNLASFGGDNADPDLLNLEPGDPVELVIDVRSIGSGAPLVSSLTNYHRKSFDDAVTEVFNVLGNRTLSRVIVATARGQINELQRHFLVTNVRYTWDMDQGVKIDFDFTNYITARWDDKSAEKADTNVKVEEEQTAANLKRKPKVRKKVPRGPDVLYTLEDSSITGWDSETWVSEDNGLTVTGKQPRSPLRTRGPK